jgi:hypothetical protein
MEISLLAMPSANSIAAKNHNPLRQKSAQYPRANCILPMSLTSLFIVSLFLWGNKAKTPMANTKKKN